MPVRNHCSRLLHLIQPSRPMLDNNNNMTTSDYSGSSPRASSPTQIHFPRRTRPINSYNLVCPEPCTPKNRHPNQICEVGASVMQSSSPNQNYGPNYNKPYQLPESTFKQRGLNVGYKCSTRGLVGQVEYLSRKLERFKIRTVKPGGVVIVKEKEEEDNLVGVAPLRCQ